MKEIVSFQTDRGLDKHEYKAINEHVNIIEELLESIGLDVPKENREALKDNIVEFVNKLVLDGCAIDKYEDNAEVTDHDKVDAYCDVIVFAVGALLKLNHDPIKALDETAKEINSRVGEMVNGKFEKDTSPEAKANWYKADYTKAKLC